MLTFGKLNIPPAAVGNITTIFYYTTISVSAVSFTAKFPLPNSLYDALHSSQNTDAREQRPARQKGASRPVK